MKEFSFSKREKTPRDRKHFWGFDRIREALTFIVAFAALIVSIFSCTSQAHLGEEQARLAKEQSVKAERPKVDWYVERGHFTIRNRDSDELTDFFITFTDESSDATEKATTEFLPPCSSESYDITPGFEEFFRQTEWSITFESGGRYWTDAGEVITPTSKPPQGEATIEWRTTDEGVPPGCES